MTEDSKPLPVACQGCGAAIEHNKTHCRYCRGEASGRRKPSNLLNDAGFGCLGDIIMGDAIAPILVWAANRGAMANNRRSRKTNMPRNRQHGH